MANHPNRKQIVVEVGKTYLTRDGRRIAIEYETALRGTYRYCGTDEQGRVTWRSAKGRFTSRASEHDLVSEA